MYPHVFKGHYKERIDPKETEMALTRQSKDVQQT